jgi:hypothetical protein
MTPFRSLLIAAACVVGPVVSVHAQVQGSRRAPIDGRGRSW